MGSNPSRPTKDISIGLSPWAGLITRAVKIQGGAERFDSSWPDKLSASLEAFCFLSSVGFRISRYEREDRGFESLRKY